MSGNVQQEKKPMSPVAADKESSRRGKDRLQQDEQQDTTTAVSWERYERTFGQALQS